MSQPPFSLREVAAVALLLTAALPAAAPAAVGDPSATTAPRADAPAEAAAPAPGLDALFGAVTMSCSASAQCGGVTLSCTASSGTCVGTDGVGVDCGGSCVLSCDDVDAFHACNDQCDADYDHCVYVCGSNYSCVDMCGIERRMCWRSCDAPTTSCSN